MMIIALIILILQYLPINNTMNLALKQNSVDPKLTYFSKSKPLSKPRCSTQDKFEIENQEGEQLSDQEDAFNMTITDRKPQEIHRIIKRSVVNRSCINTLNYNCQGLDSFPAQLSQHSIHKLAQVQKIDLSFNNISDIHGIIFSQMQSLKELLLNDNSISELPFSEINLCKGLKFINISSNKLYILPPLTRPSFIEARMNPFRLVTSDLIKLNQIEFITFDWLEYLVQGIAHQGQDRYKESTVLYTKFKTNILQKIDYEHEDNGTYCDFHSYFSVKLNMTRKQQRSDSFISHLLVKSMHRNDIFFINYLRNYQNEFNYAQLIYNNKLVLQIAFDNNNQSVLELFRLKKSNYSLGASQYIYFESVRLACRYSHYEMFQFLMSIRQQKKKIMSRQKIDILIKEVMERFDREKNSHNILHQLVNFLKEINGAIYTIMIPQQFNSKKFKALSMAILEIQQNKDLQQYFEIGSEENKGNPLHFAMKSRNQELLKGFLQGGEDIFDRNITGVSCKYVYGCTQVSRKMVWKRQKKLIKNFWIQNKEPQEQIFPSNKCSRQTIENNPSKIFIELDDSYQSFGRSFRQPMSSSRKMIRTKTVGQSQSNCMIEDKILPFLFVRIKEYVNLSWRKDYEKKLNCLNSFIEYLLKLTKYREESMMKRMEMWKTISDKLSTIYGSIRDDDPILQYEIFMASEGINGVRQDRCISSIKVEGQKASIQSGGFWCCQNLVDDV